MKKFIVYILMGLMILSCENHIDLKGDLDQIVNLNKSIEDYKSEILQIYKNKGFSIFNESVGEKNQHYSVCYEFEKSDTIISLCYRSRKYGENRTYGDCSVNKQYFDYNYKHEISLFNRDTLYHFIVPSQEKSPHFFIDYKFITGKYLYMFMCNSDLLLEGQSIFFMENIDSLRKIRGNLLPELPSIDSISIDEYREKGIMKKKFEENPFL